VGHSTGFDWRAIAGGDGLGWLGPRIHSQAWGINGLRRRKPGLHLCLEPLDLGPLLGLPPRDLDLGRGLQALDLGVGSGGQSGLCQQSVRRLANIADACSRRPTKLTSPLPGIRRRLTVLDGWGANLRVKKVLIVEDNYLITEQLAAAIEGGGFKVIGPVATAGSAVCRIDVIPRKARGTVRTHRSSSKYVQGISSTLS
jgi:hypothetical protein